MITNNKNIGIITFPASGPNKNTLSQLIELLIPISNELHVITGNEAYTDLKYSDVIFYGVFHNKGKNKFSQVLNYFTTHMKVSFYFLKKSKNADIWIFMGAETLLIPILISFFSRKKTILVLGGSAEKEYEMKANKDKIDGYIPLLFKKISLFLSDNIILYSPILIEKWNLSKYQQKILIAHRHFLRIDEKKTLNLHKKKKIIGYIGRLSKEKGVMNFVKAIPDVLKFCDAEFLICGDGPLLNKIKDYIGNHNLENNVILPGWISHDEIYKYLEQLKLLVLPSYTEGLPNIVLESMACGTPVLATPVGAVPDIIDDGVTGFIMDNNSHECVVKNIVRALQYNDTEMLTENAFNLIKSEYSYESTVKKWQKVLGEIYE